MQLKKKEKVIRIFAKQKEDKNSVSINKHFTSKKLKTNILNQEQTIHKTLVYLSTFELD